MFKNLLFEKKQLNLLNICSNLFKTSFYEQKELNLFKTVLEFALMILISEENVECFFRIAEN